MKAATSVLLALVVIIAPSTGVACRCEQLTLEEYFEQADVVALGVLVDSSENADRRHLSFKLLTTPHKGDANRRQGDQLDLATELSNATCGIQPIEKAVYVIFASRRPESDGQLWIDSCSGTRVFRPSGKNETSGFKDVPGRFVVQQLNGLGGMIVLKDVARNAPDASNVENDSLVGLLEFNALAHGGHVDIYKQAGNTASPVGRIENYDDVVSLEYGYEQPGAVVVAIADGWYRVQMSSREYGWLPVANSGTFLSYPDLPVRRLSYLTEQWSGFLWPSAGAGLPYRHERNRKDDRHEYPVNVLQSIEIGGMPWFQVELLSEVCTGNDEKKLATGWVPAYGQSGKPSVWFHSRGC